MINNTHGEHISVSMDTSCSIPCALFGTWHSTSSQHMSANLSAIIEHVIYTLVHVIQRNSFIFEFSNLKWLQPLRCPFNSLEIILEH